MGSIHGGFLTDDADGQSPTAHDTAAVCAGIAPLPAYVHLAITIVIGYFVVQLVVIGFNLWKTSTRAKILSQDAVRARGHFDQVTVSARKFHIIAAVLSVLVVASLTALDKWVLLRFGIENWPAVWRYGGLVAVAVGFVQFAKYIGNFIVKSVLGDIQVFTTHDCNAEFSAIRAAIIDAVSDALVGPLNAVDTERMIDDQHPAPLYEKIHVVGHSLGSTIALDVLIRLRQLVEQGSLALSAWRRIRSLTTFGTALEKTKYFFDVRQPTVSAAQDQWANNFYGKFFSADKNVLAEPENKLGVLYWSNHWYFLDFVANKIVAYDSDVAVSAEPIPERSASGPRPICDNHEMPHPERIWAWVHSYYLRDPLFWREFGPIVIG